MARQIKETIIDDIDGSEGAKNVRFAIDGEAYEIDLSGKHEAKLRDALAPFIKAARKGGASPTRRSRSHASSATRQSRERAASIRAWAKAHDIRVSERGRIAADVVEQYDAVN